MPRSAACGLLAILVAIAAAGFTPSQAAELPLAEGQRDLTRIRESHETEPWLRIDARGHTATVRALAFTPDSSRLCSAGLDKNVEVWNLASLRDLSRVYLRERTLRWQVARGLRGSIYALAAAGNDGLLAIGGYGAMGSLGEILLMDPVQETLVATLEGHRQTICSLAFSRNGQWLASIDTAGEARLWKRGDWTSTLLYHRDEETFGATRAAMVQQQSKLRPVVFLGNTQLVVPGFVSNAGEKRLRWQLLLLRVAKPSDFRVLDTIHYGMVTALAASPDGGRLASADLEGNLYLWNLDRAVPPDSLQADGVVLSMNFSPDGRTLVVGTSGNKPGQGQFQVWDVATRKRTSTTAVTDKVFACAVSPDGDRAAYSGSGGEIYVRTLRGDEQPTRLRGAGRPIGKVAFAQEEPLYRVAFGTAANQRGFNDYGDLLETFDPIGLALGPGVVKADSWLSPEWGAAGASVRLQNNGTLQLFRDGARRGFIDLATQCPGMNEGRPRCYCWIPDAQGNPYAIAVGTDIQDSIYLFQLAGAGPCPILRHFRGHNDFVSSVGVSRDLKYLISGSADGTVRFWSLAEFAAEPVTWSRWGAKFIVRDDGLEAIDVHPAGPLFRKGVRKGDVLTELRWPEVRGDQTERKPAAMQANLQTLPWATQIVFHYARKGVKQPAFQLLSAWNPLATLFTTSGGEWALWTPEGYYDASMNGHRLFGWQVNRGLKRLPDYFRADQFYQQLERPDVLEKLLPAGSLDEALRQAGAVPRLPQHEVLGAQLAAAPQVKILSPLAGNLLDQDTTQVKARIETPITYRLLDARAFSNGVAATRRELISEREIDGKKESVYQWELPLANDPRHLIQVVAGTDAPTAAEGEVIVRRTVAARPRQPPAMYIVALGVNSYGDRQIQSLAYPVADAQAITKMFQEKTTGLYTLAEPTLLTDREVTPAQWKKAVQALHATLKDRAKPDDLLVFFLAGHGIVDDRTQKYYYVGHDFTLADLNNRRYQDCISWEDFRILSDVPCRKIALLDTCHSGAVQPLRSRMLKAAVRELQADVVFTLTASTGEQRAAEKSDWGHGAFTKCLLEGLSGKAEQIHDGTITLEELVAYTKRAVPSLTEGLQTPTAAPDEILPFALIPLTRIP